MPWYSCRSTGTPAAASRLPYSSPSSCSTSHSAAMTIAGATPATLGASTVLTALPQGLAAAWSTYVVGNAANIYFRDAGWGGRSPREIVQDILAGAEKRKTSILGPVRDQLKAKFGR